MSHDTKTYDERLNRALLDGDILGAFEEFYDEDVVMQENSETPTVGKTTNREREKEFLASVQAFHGAELLATAVEGDRSYSEWEYDYTLEGAGRLRFVQIASRQWRNGKIVHERFVYNPGA